MKDKPKNKAREPESNKAAEQKSWTAMRVPGGFPPHVCDQQGTTNPQQQPKDNVGDDDQNASTRPDTEGETQEGDNG